MAWCHGREHYFHHILHKRFGREGGGLLEDLQKTRFTSNIDSMDTKEYFEKYLREPEATDRVVAALRTLCKWERPHADVAINARIVPYLTGVNQLAKQYIDGRERINRIILLLESFEKGETTDTGSSGHFMVMWHFPLSFNKREHSKEKFCMFDPFGRARKNDPEEYYFQKAPFMDFQDPHSNTCSLWVVFSVLQFALQAVKVPGIQPVEYDGREDTLRTEPYNDLHGRQFRENERTLYTFLLKHYFIFQPAVPTKRPISYLYIDG